VTLAPLSLVAIYTANKTAIAGFTESLAHELAEFEVRVKLVEPATDQTRASPRTLDRACRGFDS
jgi:short-subunit dehydrogenase